MKILAGVVMGSVLLMTFFPLVSAGDAEQIDAADVSPVEAVTPAVAKTPAPVTDDYNALEKDLKQDRLADALQRIQILEQDVRFLRRRVELLERDVNDIKNDRYNRTNP